MFKKDDICICKFKLRKGKGKSITYKKGCRVRIIKKIGERLYSTYNIDFERYDNIGEIYLELDLEYTRNYKLNKILE